MDDKPWELQLIHLLELVFGHNQSTQGQNLENIDDIVMTWMKDVNEFE